MASAPYRSAGGVSVAAFMVLVTYPVKAELGALLGTRLAHTNNVALASAGSEQSESIAEVTAGMNFARAEQRHDTSISYTAQGVFYDEFSDSNEVFNTLNATSEIALVLDQFFLDLYAVHDQTVVDATQPYSFNNLALTGNRTDVSILGASPNVQIAIGANVTGEVRLSEASIDYDDEELDDNDEKLAVFTLGNTNSRRGPSWETAYTAEEYDYETSPTIEFETFSVELGFWVNEVVRLFTTQGLESDYTLVAPTASDAAPSPGLDEHFWYAGIDWRPSERTEFAISSGERSYGESHRLRWSYRAALGGINLNYSEEPSSFLRDQMHSVRNTGELSPIDSLDGPNSNAFYLQKRGDLTFLLERPRSNVALRVFDERRFDMIDAVTDSEIEQTEEYRGTELNLSWSMSSRSKVGLLAQVARRRSTLNVMDDQIRSLSMTYERQVGRQGTFLVTASQERVDPKSDVGQIHYNEEQISLGIRRSFGTVTSLGAPQRFSDYLNASPAY